MHQQLEPGLAIISQAWNTPFYHPEWSLWRSAKRRENSNKQQVYQLVQRLKMIVLAHAMRDFQSKAPAVQAGPNMAWIPLA